MNVFILYSAAVRQGIVDTVKRALADLKVMSVVICGQNGIFCGGKDDFLLFPVTSQVQKCIVLLLLINTPLAIQFYENLLIW